MGRTKNKGAKRSRPGAGAKRATCPVLGDGRQCKAMNRIWIVTRPNAVSQSYATCICGRRFYLSKNAIPEGALEALKDNCHERAIAHGEISSILSSLWPEGQHSVFAKVGVVPVGTKVLHKETRFIGADAGELVSVLGSRLLSTMEGADGIGLAANQVGAPVRMLAHNLLHAAPPLLFNPVLLSSSGEWVHVEGCLSLQVPGVRARVRRPRVVTLAADLPDGNSVILTADELLSRVLQHELDHLEGIEYVQRLVGEDRDRVYRTMASAGVAIKWLPFRPYLGL